MTAELPVLPSAADTSRRRWLRDQLALLAAPALGVPGRADAAPYGVTIAAMQAARENETGVHHHYTEFGRQASRDGYRGVAYLFHAIAASELVHATSFGKVLTRLGVEPVPIPRPAVRAGTTRENLIRAARGEIDSIESFYPKLLAQITPEGLDDAISTTRHAWECEKQHRDKMAQIQRWAPALFENVARTIDEKTGRYFVCQLCGSTTNAVPPDACPVCRQPSAHYRLTAPPA